jgi:hypothetical protein
MISFEAILIGDKTIARNNLAHKSFTLKDWEGDGSSSSPFLIKSVEDLNRLSTRVGAGNTYSGKYFKLTTNLTYS